MFFVDTDFFEPNVSSLFVPMIKSGTGGRISVQVYASGGMAAGKGCLINYGHSTSFEGYFATAVVASVNGAFGYCAAAIASGCQGWAQIRGQLDNMQGHPTCLTGSLGHAFRIVPTGIIGTTSTYVNSASQVAVLREEVDGSSTANVWLVGRLSVEV